MLTKEKDNKESCWNEFTKQVEKDSKFSEKQISLLCKITKPIEAVGLVK